MTKLDDNKFVLIAGDNGVGMPKAIFDGESTSLGVELIKIFTEQLDGEIKQLETEGTVYELIFTKIVV